MPTPTITAGVKNFSGQAGSYSLPVALGDIVVVFMVQYSAATTPSVYNEATAADAGFTAVTDTPLSVGSTLRLAVMWKYADADDVALSGDTSNAYEARWDGVKGGHCQAAVIHGGPTSGSPFLVAVASRETNGTTSEAVQLVTTSKSLLLWAASNAPYTALGLPDGFSTLYSDYSGNESQFASMTQTAAGATGDIVATQASGPSLAALLAISDDSSAPESHSGTGAITATPSLSSAGRKAAVGAAVIAATATLTAAGIASETHSGTGSITATPTISSTGQKKATGDGVLIWYVSVTGSGHATTVQQESGSGSITATADLSSSGKKNAEGDVELAATVTIDGSGRKSAAGTGSTTATVAITGRGHGSENQASSGTGSITAAYQILASGRKNATGTGGITATATITGSGANKQNYRDLSVTVRLEPNRIRARLEAQ